MNKDLQLTHIFVSEVSAKVIEKIVEASKNGYDRIQ